MYFLRFYLKTSTRSQQETKTKQNQSKNYKNNVKLDEGHF